MQRLVQCQSKGSTVWETAVPGQHRRKPARWLVCSMLETNWNGTVSCCNSNKASEIFFWAILIVKLWFLSPWNGCLNHERGKCAGCWAFLWENWSEKKEWACCGHAWMKWWRCCCLFTHDLWRMDHISVLGADFNSLRYFRDFEFCYLKLIFLIHPQVYWLDLSCSGFLISHLIVIIFGLLWN